MFRKGTSAPPAALPQHHRSRGSIWSVNPTRTIAYVVLLLLSYSFGRYTSTTPHPINYTIHSASNIAAISAQINNETDCIHAEVEQEQEHNHNLPQPEQVLVEHVAKDKDDVKFDDHNIFGPVCGAESVPNSTLARQTIIDRVFNGITPWKQFPPPHVTNLLRPRRVQGWGSTRAVFRNLIQKVKPKIIIEVGTFLGASALHMVELSRELGLSDTQILCVDDFRGWPGFQNEAWSRSDDIKMVNGDVMLLYQFMQNVVQANATESVIFLPFSTGSALQKLCEWGVLGDLVEVDAGHDFHSAWLDINRAFKILRPGGVLFGHDYNAAADNRGVRRAVDKFAKVQNLRVRLDGQHWVLYDKFDQ